MQTIIYLVRHGDVYNPKAVVYGRLPDFPLSEEGKKQATKLGKHLSSKKLSAIYASPLDRTRQTAAIVASYHPDITVMYDERLLEVKSPHFEGKPIRDAEKVHWDFYKPEFILTGAEDLSDIWKRMNHFIQEAVGKHKGQEIVIVSHGDPIMVSMVKHKGKVLHLKAIRGEEYVQKADGFILAFEGYKATGVSKLGL